MNIKEFENFIYRMQAEGKYREALEFINERLEVLKKTGNMDELAPLVGMKMAIENKLGFFS